MWPIQLVVNELPYSIRKKNILLGGIWVGNESPNMKYYHLFADQMKNLSVDWYYNDDKITSKVYVILCSCDSVARCKLQNVVQYNGHYGCSWCLHKGKSVKKGKGHMMSYSLKSHTELALARTVENTLSAAETALRTNKPVDGVKGPCALGIFPLFNIVSGFVVDYMHCICLGIVKNLTMHWMNSTNSHCKFYISLSQQLRLSEKLVSFKVPSLIRRKPRSLDCVKYWKATEWLYWLIFYSPSLLRKILPLKFFNHWMLLVCSVNQLLSSEISEANLNIVEYLLTKFVIETSQLYGEEQVTYNVHILLHIPDCVRNWGMLWNYSNFSYESFNGVLKNYIRSSQKTAYQVAERFLIFHFIKNSADSVFHNRTSQVLYADLIRGYRLIKSANKIGDVIIGKRTKMVDMSVVMSFKEKTQVNCSQLYSFKSVQHVYDFIPEGSQNSLNKRSCNCVIFNKQGECAVLKHIVSVKKLPTINEIYLIVTSINCLSKSLLKIPHINYKCLDYKLVNKIEESVNVWKLCDISVPDFLFRNNGKKIVFPMPMSIEAD